MQKRYRPVPPQTIAAKISRVVAILPPPPPNIQLTSKGNKKLQLFGIHFEEAPNEIVLILINIPWSNTLIHAFH
jgi:hypothetical protein